jgi:hypothetical protein
MAGSGQVLSLGTAAASRSRRAVLMRETAASSPLLWRNLSATSNGLTGAERSACAASGTKAADLGAQQVTLVRRCRIGLGSGEFERTLRKDAGLPPLVKGSAQGVLRSIARQGAELAASEATKHRDVSETISTRVLIPVGIGRDLARFAADHRERRGPGWQKKVEITSPQEDGSSGR